MANMEQLITSFYESFGRQDAEGMVACYHEDIVFEDPAFGPLKGADAGNMWRMLCQNARELKVTYDQIEVNGTQGKAHWEAIYLFSQTGRKVHNKIDAKFEFKDGKIIRHTDYFDLHRWAKQALGFKGALLGGTGFFKKKINQQTARNLQKFTAKQG